MHAHTHSARHKNRLWAVFGLTSCFLVVEVAAALVTGSLSLLADAAHMLVDAGGLLMSLFAVWFAERPATPAKTYGYYRAEILAAFVNAQVLLVMGVGILVGASTMADSGFPNLANPFRIPSLEFLQVALVLFPFCILGSAGSLVVRYRRSRGIERDQLKLLAFAAATVAASYLVIMLLSIGSTSSNTPGWLGVAQTLVIFSFSLIPISIGVAILRHGLYEIDLIIRKTVRYAVLVALLGSVAESTVRHAACSVLVVRSGRR